MTYEKMVDFCLLYLLCLFAWLIAFPAPCLGMILWLHCLIDGHRAWLLVPVVGALVSCISVATTRPPDPPLEKGKCIARRHGNWL